MPRYVVRVESHTIEIHYHYALVEAASEEDAVEAASTGAEAVLEQTESWLSTSDTTDLRAEVLPSDSDEWDDLPNWSI